MQTLELEVEMTLIITIVGPAGIHQSADFRLSKHEPGADGEWIESQPNSSKIVCLRYEHWSGLLTYCGIGMWKEKRTDEYAAEWLTRLVGAGATLQDALEAIHEQGTSWIRDINRNIGSDQPHSFVLAGYEGGIPAIAIASNYQTLTGRITPISPDLRLDMRRSATGVHVFISGIRSAVPEATRHRLKHLVRIGADANVIRYEMGRLNRLAAQSPFAKNGISASCLTYSIDVRGGGGGEVHGDVPAPVIPRMIFNGTDVAKSVARLFPGTKLVQSAFVTAGSNDAATRERIDCELRVKAVHQEGNKCDLTAVEEAGALNEYHLSMHDLNNEKCIVGQWRNPVGATPHAFIWQAGNEIQDLGTFGGPFSNALSVNDDGQVVGTSHGDQSATHAFLWDRHDGMRDLGTLGGRDSVARCINNNCQIVGSSFADAGNPEAKGERAFIWTPTTGMRSLGNEFEGWSTAIAINREGLVLGQRRRGAAVCGFVWSPELGAVDILGEDDRGFYPCAINDSGLVVGEGDDSSGKRRAFRWTREEGLTQLAVTDDFHPAAVDVHGNILGNVTARPWSRPYLYSAITGALLALPFVDEHHTSVKSINSSGVVIGAAWKGPFKHSHPLIWRLNCLWRTESTEFRSS